jgi:hypothetical protein
VFLFPLRYLTHAFVILVTHLFIYSCVRYYNHYSDISFVCVIIMYILYMYITLYLSGILPVYEFKYYYRTRALHEGKTTIYLYPTIATYLVLCKPCIVLILPKTNISLVFRLKYYQTHDSDPYKSTDCTTVLCRLKPLTGGLPFLLITVDRVFPTLFLLAAVPFV